MINSTLTAWSYIRVPISIWAAHSRDKQVRTIWDKLFVLYLWNAHKVLLPMTVDSRSIRSVELLTITVSLTVCLRYFQDHGFIWDEDLLQNSEETAFVTPFFRLVNDRKNNFLKFWKFWEISSKQIEENQRQSQIIAGWRAPPFVEP